MNISPESGFLNFVDGRERDLAASDLSCAYCVEAAAGTGKTTLLIERLLTIVRSGEAELKDVVAITFTEKAAAELKVRLREQLEAHCRNSAGPQRGSYSQALAQLDRANISTIHAFAASLLRERPVEAEVDPGFEQLDEMGSQLLFDEVWQRWKEEELANLPPVLRRLLALEVSLDSIRTLAAKLLDNRDLALLPGPPPPPSPVNEIWGQIVAIVRKLEELKSRCTDEFDRGYRQIQELSNTIAQTPADELDRERAILLDLKVDIKSGAQKNWSPASACVEQKGLCKELRAILENAAERLGPNLVAGLQDWLKGFLLAVEGEKRVRGVLDFQDLLLKARNLVRDHPEVRRYFQRRIRFLLVDEFQDTDPLQAELVFFLAEQGADAKDWSQVQLAPDKLFLVGDPKQSIYRFRRADIRMYDRAKHLLSALHAPLIIRQNFRSSPRLLKAVNGLFAPQMLRSDYQADYVPLEPAPDRPDAGAGLALLFPSDTYVAGGMPGYFQHEAELIARFIQHVANSADSPVRVWDKQKKQARPPAFRDIAILFPVTSGLPYYEEALRACGVPFQLDAGRQFYARREVRDLLSVLQAVDNPEDAIAITAALRSRFFGLSDEDLFLYHHAGGRFHYLRQETEAFPRVAGSLQQLRRWHERRATTPLSVLVDGILDESCILQFSLMLPEGEQTVANLLRIVELARRFESQPGACLRALVTWLERRAAAEVAEADAALADQEDAIHMLTIHGAKGLEFPVVALASMACNQRQGENVLIDHAGGQIAISLRCGDHRLRTANFEPLAASEQQRGGAEDLRLFYVAATRAKDCLVVPRVAPANSRNARFLDFFDSQLQVYGGKPQRTTCIDGVLSVPAEDLPMPSASSAVLRQDVGILSASEELVAPILADRQSWSDSASNIGLTPHERSAHAGGLFLQCQQEVENLPKGACSQPTGQEEWRSGATAEALGTAFHRILHQVQLQDEPLLNVLVDHVAAALQVTQHAATLRDWVTRTLASLLLERVRKARRVWRELPFCVDYQGKVTEGYIDLLFEENGSLVLVNYKTEDVKPKDIAAAVEAHRPQMDPYCHAVGQLTGQYPRDLLLYFVRPGLTRAVSPSATE